jgi:hypothetical protein
MDSDFRPRLRHTAARRGAARSASSEYRKPASTGFFWQLSGGVIRCGGSWHKGGLRSVQGQGGQHLGGIRHDQVQSVEPKSRTRAGRKSSGPSSLPYSPECAGGSVSEVVLPLLPVLKSSSPRSRPPLYGVAVLGPLPLGSWLATELRPGPLCDPLPRVPDFF